MARYVHVHMHAVDCDGIHGVTEDCNTNDRFRSGTNDYGPGQNPASHKHLESHGWKKAKEFGHPGGYTTEHTHPNHPNHKLRVYQSKYGDPDEWSHSVGSGRIASGKAGGLPRHLNKFHGANDSFAEVEKHAEKEYGSEEAGKRVAAAVGFKKFGKAGMERKAQAGRK